MVERRGGGVGDVEDSLHNGVSRRGGLKTTEPQEPASQPTPGVCQLALTSDLRWNDSVFGASQRLVGAATDRVPLARKNSIA